MAKNGFYSRFLAYRRRRNGKPMPLWLKALIIVGGLLTIASTVLAGVSYGVYRSYANDLIPPDEAIARLPLGGATILDRNGRFLYQFVDDRSGIRNPVPLDEVSRDLIDATIATEDASFWDNPGVNFRGLTAAALENFSPFGDTPGFLQGRGGSSITQQLIKNVYFSFEERSERNIDRKLKETVLALELTRQYSKEQILEWYLNLISYGNLYNGVEAASQGYFGKAASELTLAEGALLAGIPSSPSRYDPVNNFDAAKQRQVSVLIRMHTEGYIDDDKFWEEAARPIDIQPQQFPVQAPHFVFNVVQTQLERLFGEEAVGRDGLVVHTTLDLDWQERAEEIVEESVSTFEYSGGHNGAFVAIDPNTAEIIVYVGSRDYFRDDIDGRNDMAAALNSPGSSFKPITYLTSFIELGWGPGTMVLDTPVSSEYWHGARPPQNYSGNFAGPITVRNALGNSLNVSAVKTILYVGVTDVIEQAKRMGITTFDGRTFGPSLTVGGADVRLIDMVYAFSVLPNLGLLKGQPTELDLPAGNRTLDPISIVRVETRDGEILYPEVESESAEQPVLQEERVAPAEASYLIANIMSDGNSRCRVFGCGALTIPGRRLAVKTGTSEPYADNTNIGDTWAMGFTPQLVAGAWFGNADNSPMFSIRSDQASWGMLRTFMLAYHEDLPVLQFERPDGLVEARTCVPSGLKPTGSCPLTTPPDLFAEDSLSDEDDNWWERARIDTRTGKLASDLTPDEYAEDRFFLQLPDDLPAFHRDEALVWAFILRAIVDEVPTERTEEGDVPTLITAPADGAQVDGEVTVTGRARSIDFESYRLEYLSEDQPDEWALIASGDDPVSGGTLGTWDTEGLPNGRYTIRLVVVDRLRGEFSTQIAVELVRPTPTPDALAPTATPEEDSDDRPGRGPPSDR
jgi:membrane peptidoglycan carboxypeptidase